MKFLKTTIIGGVVFLIPVVVIVMIVGEAVNVMLIVAEPVADMIPIERFAGIALVNVVAGLALLLICFLAGLLARATSVMEWVEKVEAKFLAKIPGYTIIKGISSSLSDPRNAKLKSVLVSLPGGARMGLEVERIRNDQVSVYFPGSPNAWSGFVQIVPASAIEPLDVPMMRVIEHAEQLGRGIESALSGVSVKPWTPARD